MRGSNLFDSEAQHLADNLTQPSWHSKGAAGLATVMSHASKNALLVAGQGTCKLCRMAFYGVSV